MKKCLSISLVLFLLLALNANAGENNLTKTINYSIEQEDIEATVVDNLLSVEFLLTNTGLRYERKLADRHALAVSAGLGFPFSVSASKVYYSNGTSKSSTSAYIAVLPQVGIAYRFYYNLQRRIHRDKSVYANSANYFTVLSSFGFTPIYSNYPNKFSFITNIAPAWGMHRTFIKSNMDINFNIGLGYGYNNGSGSYVAPILNFTFGYVVLPKHKNIKSATTE